MAQRHWTTRTVVEAFSAKVEEATGDNPLSASSEIRNMRLGDVIELLMRWDWGIATPEEIPGQTTITGVDDGFDSTPDT